MKLKAGVKLDVFSPQILLAIYIADQVYVSMFNKEMVITSISDSVHGSGSLHPLGKAVDIRARDVTSLGKNAFVVAMKTKLGDNYDVVLEKDHFHIEFDPD